MFWFTLLLWLPLAALKVLFAIVCSPLETLDLVLGLKQEITERRQRHQESRRRDESRE